MSALPAVLHGRISGGLRSLPRCQLCTIHAVPHDGRRSVAPVRPPSPMSGSNGYYLVGSGTHPHPEAAHSPGKDAFQRTTSGTAKPSIDASAPTAAITPVDIKNAACRE